jgi:DNA-binding response OmpR family regulator
VRPAFGAQDDRANAVLLDLRMPGIDGLEVLSRIRARSQAPPVAILTAVPTSANTIEAMRLGAVDHIAKPIGRVELEALLDRMLAPAPAAAEPASVPAVENELGPASASPGPAGMNSASCAWTIVEDMLS